MGNEDNFVIAPKKLLSDKNLSDAAKVMYLLLKDRMTLSIKNGYTDDFGKPCIIYTYESLAELLAWTNKKISKILDELDNCGLISRYRRRGCKPNFIYVKELDYGVKIIPVDEQKTQADSKNNEVSKGCEGDGYKEVSKVEEGSGCSEFTNHTNFTDCSGITNNTISTDYTDYTDEIRGKIDYDMLLNVGNRKEELDMFVSTVNDVLTSRQRAMRICGETYPIKVVKERFRDIDRGTFEYVSEILSRNKGEIRNICAYVISLIFNEKSKNDVFFTQTTDEERRAREIKEARKAELERKMEELINKGPPKFEKRRV